MFRNNGNFEFFLKKYDTYLSPVINTYAYCLLNNHFHFLIQIKSRVELIDFQKSTSTTSSPFMEKPSNEIVSHHFRRLFQSYALEFNKQHDRIGTLFQTPFKRALINDDSYFTQLIYYIHANPQNHRLVDDFRQWKWSSYNRIILDKPSKLKKQEVIEWFGDTNRYKEYHSAYHKMLNNDKIIFED
jgi:putative transposase